MYVQYVRMWVCSVLANGALSLCLCIYRTSMLMLFTVSVAARANSVCMSKTIGSNSLRMKTNEIGRRAERARRLNWVTSDVDGSARIHVTICSRISFCTPNLIGNKNPFLFPAVSAVWWCLWFVYRKQHQKRNTQSHIQLVKLIHMEHTQRVHACICERNTYEMKTKTTTGNDKKFYDCEIQPK